MVKIRKISKKVLNYYRISRNLHSPFHPFEEEKIGSEEAQEIFFSIASSEGKIFFLNFLLLKNIYFTKKHENNELAVKMLQAIEKEIKVRKVAKNNAMALNILNIKRKINKMC